MKPLDAEIRKKAVSTGVILGIVLIVCNVFSFYFMTSIATTFWMVTFSPLIFGFIIPVVIAVVFCGDLRKKVGGYWTFRQATSGIFVMFLVSYIISYVGYNVIFIKLVERHAMEKMESAVVNATTTYLEKQNIDQATIDNKVEDIRKNFEIQSDTAPGKVILSVVVSLILLFVISLIFAAIFKKDPPLFDRPAAADGDPVV